MPKTRSLVAELGDAHEHRYLNELRSTGVNVVDLEEASLAKAPGAGQFDLAAQVERTLAAMRSGTEVVFQGWVGDSVSFGRTDFLRKVAVASELGSWSYEVVDTKLALSAKPSALLQLLFYSRHVAEMQGVLPEQMHLVLGDGRMESYTVAHYIDYADAVRAEFEAFRAAPPEVYPWPCAHCQVCDWANECGARRSSDDHISTVAWLTRNQGELLIGDGVSTVAELAATKAAPKGVGAGAFERIQRQAALQTAARVDGEHHFEVLDPIYDEADPSSAKNLGLLLLPPPDEGDLFFDVEGYPHADGGLEYLWGFADRSGTFTAFWGLNQAEERVAFESAVDFIMERWRAHPGMHVYHYASYERAALGRLMGRLGSREFEVDSIFRGKLLVDLYVAVRNGVAVSQPSYSIKYLEPLYGFEREEHDLRRGDDSILMFHDAVVAPSEPDRALLQTIENYNRDDCLSTLKLDRWLRELREALTGRVGETGVLYEPDVVKDLTEAEQARAELAQRLLADVPDVETDRTPEQQAKYLLAHCLEFHRREEKPNWWAHFGRLAAFDAEGPSALFDDPECLGSIEHLDSTPGSTGRNSWTHRYRFDPDELHKFHPEDKAVALGHLLADGKSVPKLTVSSLDPTNGVIELRGAKYALDHVTALVPDTPFSNAAIVAAIESIARLVDANGIDSTDPRNAQEALLLRSIPRTSARQPGSVLVGASETMTADLVDLIAGLDRSFLAVQGPPGTGKTWSSSQVIVELVRRGYKVGVTAHSHKVIGNLIEGICEAADNPAFGEPLSHDELRIHQNAEPHQASDANRVIASKRGFDPALDDSRVVTAGTVWEFARHEDAFDVVFVDEAGQFSLANSVAVARAGKSVVFVGDPQQLSQPSKGCHPEGVDVSALDHLFGGENTVSPDAGVLLSHTRRMHPAIAHWSSQQFYDGRLSAHPTTHQQAIGGDDWMAEPGIHFVPVEHVGNTVRSREEAKVVAELVERLIGRSWTNEKGEVRPLTLADILIVVPYNAHLGEVIRRLPDDARVGTVDRFQGQEAAVAIFTLAASDASGGRGAAFLFSPHRLNVALTRARVLSIVVGEPSLRTTQVRSPAQMRNVSAFCSATSRRTAE